MTKKLIVIVILLAAGLIYRSYSRFHSVHESIHTSSDLEDIRKRGKLVAVTDINSTDYFIYNGEPMGFNYELLKSFSDFIGIDLEIISENHIDRASSMLSSGEADLLAYGFPLTDGAKTEMLLTTPVDETRQVLVQRKPAGWRKMSGEEVRKSLVNSKSELAGKKIYVQERSAHAVRLKAIQKEIGSRINIVEVPLVSEKLIGHVAKGELDYTVCDENVAKVNATYYPEIDVTVILSNPQELAWGVRKTNSEDLLKELNRWITSYRKTDSYALLHAKYFRNSRSSTIVRSDFYPLITGRVSQYDDLIRKFSATINWDWRLLASLIYQESNFKPDVRSTAGAYGLMQIMPITGRNFGIDITASPENNLKAGILYINWLHSIFDKRVPDEKERLSFILASYNAGPGHVLDAMRLAEKHGMDPQKWEGNVEVWLQKKSDPKYYKDEVVKSGFFRGTESVEFVSEVLDRYEHYRNIIPVEAVRPF